MDYIMRCLALAGTLRWVLADTIEICNAELNVPIRCNSDEVIVVTSAEYGRMRLGRCISEDNEFMGCRNDVLLLIDKWCSGRRQCQLSVPDPELEKLSTDCLKVLIKYLFVDYSCMPVNSQCSSSRPTSVRSKEGLISSWTYDNKGCGSANSEWIISAEPGQTINISMLDFGRTPQASSSLVSCPAVYGYIGEVSLAINHTICSGAERQRALYSSKSNVVAIQMVPKSVRGERSFLLKYVVTGCAEISRPAHAWYRRDGNEAVIGCESSDKQWRLVCVGNTWKGEMGNCSGPADVIVIDNKPERVGLDSVVVMTGIAGGAVVLCVVAIVAGTVYIKKYRMRQETKFLTKTYETIGKNSLVTYEPRDAANIPSTWDRSQNAMMSSYPEVCTCSSLPGHIVSGDERQSLYSSIKSS